MLDQPRGMHRDRPILGALVVVVAAIFGSGLIATAAATLRQSAEAQVRVIAELHYDPPSGRRIVWEGDYVRYEFAVNGAVYSSTAFRQRTLGETEDVKACYDPSNPADHRLVEASTRCGTW